jgi:hypothetical protein
MYLFGLAFSSLKRELPTPEAISTNSQMFGYLSKSILWNVDSAQNASNLKATNWSFHVKGKSILGN